MSLEFPIVKLLDYESQWEFLEESTNPFAVVVMAHLRTLTTTQDPSGRLRWKLRLIRGLYERGYSQQDVLELFRLLDWMMGLPEDLQLEFQNAVIQFEEEKKMPYRTSFEQVGYDKGQQEASVRIISSILRTRFGEIDANDALRKIIEPLVQMQPDEFTPLLLTLSGL